MVFAVKDRICEKDCQHCQPYNDNWAVCWAPVIKASRVQMHKDCTAAMVEREIKKEKANAKVVKKK